jgi:cell division protein FtsX
MRALVYAWQEAVASLARARWTLLLSIATIAVAFAMLGWPAAGRKRRKCRSTSTTW